MCKGSFDPQGVMPHRLRTTALWGRRKAEDGPHTWASYNEVPDLWVSTPLCQAPLFTLCQNEQKDRYWMLLCDVPKQ